MAKLRDMIKASGATIPSTSAIIGTFEGECADANITNKNGLDITRPVWENVFASEDYEEAIRLGWYIGFLGHPEDPNCMDFEHACIVMTEGHIDSNGKVYGKFNLIDTPVGRIVKAFIDAGVTFGISVRGAGDIENNSVDPDTFVFRGFDLVTFPAFPESIPTFSEIAASTDMNKRANYKSVCKTVNNNLDKITMCETLDVIKSQFASQSEEYKAIQAREDKLCNDDCQDDIADTRLDSMTRLYLEQVEANTQLRRMNESLKRQLATTQVDCSRKIKSMERITASQYSDIQKRNKSLQDRNRSLRDKVLAAQRSCDSLKIKNDKLSRQNSELINDKESVSRRCGRYVSSNKQLNSEITSLRDSNLKYKQKIDASSNEIREKDSIISRLRSELDETVNAASRNESRTSNLDDKNRKLSAKLEAAERLVEEYQDAYASLYANAIGVNLGNISVTANTSVSDMQKLINGGSNMNISEVFVEPIPEEVLADDAEDDIVTM